MLGAKCHCSSIHVTPKRPPSLAKGHKVKTFQTENEQKEKAKKHCANKTLKQHLNNQTVQDKEDEKRQKNWNTSQKYKTQKSSTKFLFICHKNCVWFLCIFSLTFWSVSWKEICFVHVQKMWAICVFVIYKKYIPKLYSQKAIFVFLFCFLFWVLLFLTCFLAHLLSAIVILEAFVHNTTIGLQMWGIKQCHKQWQDCQRNQVRPKDSGDILDWSETLWKT